MLRDLHQNIVSTNINQGIFESKYTEVTESDRQIK